MFKRVHYMIVLMLFVCMNIFGDDTQKIATMVNHALRWLKEHQDEDGSWKCGKYEGHDYDHAATGLALLAFLGCGHSHKTSSEFQATVSKAIRWFLNEQASLENNNFANNKGDNNGYQRGIALLAMVDAYGLSLDDELKPHVQRAVDQACRDQGHDGGWGHNPTDTGDTSVSGWFVLALRSAKLSKLIVPNRAWDGAKGYFTKIAQSDGEYYAGQNMIFGDTGVTPLCTAVLMTCRLYLGKPRDDPIVEGAAGWLMSRSTTGNYKEVFPTVAMNRGLTNKRNFYLWYYQALGFFQFGTNSEEWRTFIQMLNTELKSTQIMTGTYKEKKGSWDLPVDDMSYGDKYFGRIGQTAVGVLMLELYLRYDHFHK